MNAWQPSSGAQALAHMLPRGGVRCEFRTLKPRQKTGPRRLQGPVEWLRPMSEPWGIGPAPRGAMRWDGGAGFAGFVDTDLLLRVVLSAAAALHARL